MFAREKKSEELSRVFLREHSKAFRSACQPFKEGTGRGCEKPKSLVNAAWNKGWEALHMRYGLPAGENNETDEKRTKEGDHPRVSGR